MIKVMELNINQKHTISSIKRRCNQKHIDKIFSKIESTLYNGEKRYHRNRTPFSFRVSVDNVDERANMLRLHSTIDNMRHITVYETGEFYINGFGLFKKAEDFDNFLFNQMTYFFTDITTIPVC